MRVILDFAAPWEPEDRQRRVFQAPRRNIRADMPGQVPAALAALMAAQAEGYWLAGWFAYELGYALEPKLAPCQRGNGPLLVFGVFDAPTGQAPSPTKAYAGPLQPEWDAAAYGRAFARVKAYIAAGDIYQANLSFRAGFAFAGDPFALYTQLAGASAAPYSAYIEEEGRSILSLSPELFFDLTAAGVLTARPMKGTMPKEAGAAALAASSKDRAENLMIVDLIRNDLGRVARLGSVAASDLFRIEAYPTLNTMVSTVTAELKPGAGIGEIVRALFPCGSVTGAPKIRAMEILRELEDSDRGAYCGAIGYFAPLKGEEGGSARFNVSIRTLTIADGRGSLGIGGGVVQDSAAASEYAECLLKARFFEVGRVPLRLIETLRYEDTFVRLDRHLARMEKSASVFGLGFDTGKAMAALQAVVAGQTGPLRARLTLDEAGEHHAIAAPLAANPPHWTYAMSPRPVASRDPLLHHKTDWREFYEQEAARHGSDEVLFLNERGELAEGVRSNIFIRRDGKLLTPPLSAGILPGCLRAELIEQGACSEAVLTPDDLARGEVYFGNSLRGLIPAIPL
jgi:para-aminobenzoate synthetase / 4-amino-4-deoxychorismate lyase